MHFFEWETPTHHTFLTAKGSKIVFYDLYYDLSTPRDYMTLDRYTMERGIDFVPAIDVDSSVTCLADLHQLRSKVREILRCFDRPKFIHLGPKITSILTNSESISIYDYIPAPLEETTFMLCANGMTKKDSKQSSTLVMPENVILVHYGFQVSKAVLYKL